MPLRVVLYLCVMTTDLHETLVVATRSCNASTMKRTVCFLSVAVLGNCARAISTFAIDEKSVSWAPRTLQPKHEFVGCRPLLCVVDPTPGAAYPNGNRHTHPVCAVGPWDWRPNCATVDATAIDDARYLCNAVSLNRHFFIHFSRGVG